MRCDPIVYLMQQPPRPCGVSVFGTSCKTVRNELQVSPGQSVIAAVI